ncbi:MAG: nudF [Candidatus Magasanikbacteria bacterium]|nr:nudF [Candidatus Magasanikbacteria bacterium]
MKNFPWKTTRREVIHKSPWYSYIHDEFKRPNGESGDYFYVHTTGSAYIVPQIGSDAFVMIETYRYLNKKIGFEFPGGGLKVRQKPEAAALAELKEETGYTAAELIKIGRQCPMPGVTDEWSEIFFASGLRGGRQKLDPHEAIKVKIFRAYQIDAMIKSGKIWDAPSIAAWQQTKLYLSRGLEQPRPITDAVILNQRGDVLLLKRVQYPFIGSWVLPGGHIEYNETCEQAVLRETKEETGLTTKIVHLVGVYSGLKRDPRYATISIVYLLKIIGGRLQAEKTEAKTAKFFPLKKLPKKLGFDHAKILSDLIRRHGRFF